MADDVPLAHVALRPSDVALLGRCGFRSTRDLDGVASAAALAALLRVDEDAAATLLGAARRGAAGPCWRPAAALAAEGDAAIPVVTFCRALDDALGGGVFPGSVLEVVGAPGSGKTQLAVQVCVDAAIPAVFGGRGARAVFVDAEGAFCAERCAAVARETVRHVRKTARKRGAGEAARAAAAAFTVDGVLEGIEVRRVLDHAELFAAVRSAPDDVGVVVVDSVAAHLRSLDGDPAVRARLLARLGAALHRLARRGAAVVATNQVTTRIGPPGGDDAASAAALGEAWSHAASHRVVLDVAGSGARSWRLVKSPDRPDAGADFAVDGRGVRDAARGVKPPS